MSSHGKILIIDDDPALRKLYEQRLHAAGYDIITASNGNEGVEQALTHQPNLVLLDLMMPAKGGLGVLEILKTMPQTKDIPVIVMTAYPADNYREKSTRIGVAHFFSKAEITPAEIVEKVQALLAS